MGSTWVLSAPDEPHDDPMNLAIRVDFGPEWETYLYIRRYERLSILSIQPAREKST